MIKKANPDSSLLPTSTSRVTLRTISEATGLSLSTVSLALRGGTTLRPETRAKVSDAAKALGYVPDRAGVRLRTGKTNVVALVLDGAEDSIDFARQMIQGIGTAIKGTRYHLTVMPEFERNQSAETVRYILANRTADGVIITHTAPRDQRVQMLIDAGMPFVSHGRTEFFSPHPYYDFDSESFTVAAIERLVSKTCRRLMLVVGDDQTTNHHNIVTAFHRSVARMAVEGEVLDRLQFREAADMRQLGLQIADRSNRPDGIICDSEIRTIALIRGLEEKGVQPGNGIELVYKQTSDLLSTLYPRVDSVREDVLAAGGELTRLLLRRIEGASPQELQTVAEPELHWRSL